MRLVLILPLFLLLVSCATPNLNYSPEVSSFSRPSIGAVTTVSVGDEMLSQGTLIRRDGIELAETVKISGYTLTPGFYPRVGGDEKFTYNGFANGVSSSGYGSLSANFLVDPPQVLQADLAKAKLCVVTILNVAACKMAVKFEFVQKVVESDRSFQQTLLYSGRVGDKINIGYREFYGDSARTAFNNEVEYDLGTSSVIAYKGAKVRIIKATNTDITYEVISNFNVK